MASTSAPSTDDPRLSSAPLPGVELSPAGGARVSVWAPRCAALGLVVADAVFPLRDAGRGWWVCESAPLHPGARYRFALPDGRRLPDPTSCYQPEGVFGDSEVVDFQAFAWTDDTWAGVPRAELVIYELHLGTFTAEGTCAAAIAHLDELVELGITAIELMPVAQCPGQRNWGYDGVFPFAVQHSYGGPRGLQALVDACHARGLAVILDVVYNHFGPEGNHLGEYMPLTTDRHRIPWGEAVNVDGPGSDGVRAYLLANARHWITRYHLDGLRVDAVHAICDYSARPFLGELTAQARVLSAELGRPLHLIAESDLNASRMVRPAALGGLGFDSQWTDDFHHALHALLTGERQGYYADYGTVDDLRRAFAQAFVYDGRWSHCRQMTWGDSAGDLDSACFTVCAQNHDQIGNRCGGERLAVLTDGEGLKAAAAAVLLSPYLPLLFMGEEWGERRPFLYFVDHSDPALVAAVRRGRAEEFAALNGVGAQPRDPFDPATRDASRLDRTAAAAAPGRTLRDFHRECLGWRKRLPSLRPGPRAAIAVSLAGPAVIAVERRRADCRTLLLLNPTAGEGEAGLPPGRWTVALASAAARWNGPGWAAERVERQVRLTPRSAVLLRHLGDAP